MQEYFKTPNGYYLYKDFIMIRDILNSEIPGSAPSRRSVGFIDDPIDGFSAMTTALEKLFFRDNFENHHTYTSIYNGKSQSNKDILLEDSKIFESGISFTKAPSTHYYEIQGSTHLEAAESLFKNTSNHFLRITTKNNILFVYTNKTLTFKDFCQLKLLQWEITKENFRTPCPEAFEFVQHIANEEWKEASDTINNFFDSKVFKEFKYIKFDKIFQPNNEKQINALTNSISNKEADYKYWMNELSKIATEITDMKEKLWVMKTQEQNKEDNKALLKHIFNHPYIKNVTKISDEQVKFYFESPIIYFDEWLIKKIYDNHTEQDKQIFDIFLKNEYELMTHCAIKFNTQTFRIDMVETSYEDNYIGHPHIDRYHCFGNHNIAISEAALDNNYLGAIEQISQATMNLNFSDSTVIDEMCYTLKCDLRKPTWRHKETGAILSTEEVWEVYRNEKTSTDTE